MMIEEFISFQIMINKGGVSAPRHVMKQTNIIVRIITEIYQLDKFIDLSVTVPIISDYASCMHR